MNPNYLCYYEIKQSHQKCSACLNLQLQQQAKKRQFASIAIYLADGMQTLGIAARLKLLNQQSVTMQKVG